MQDESEAEAGSGRQIYASPSAITSCMKSEKSWTSLYHSGLISRGEGASPADKLKDEASAFLTT